ncbi:hypothetical protein PMAYCL1PPCAC_01947, partial [Pristionchus mayeri]
ERAPLGLVSRRWRSVDLGIGKRTFGCVVLGLWQNQKTTIRALFPSFEEGKPRDGYEFITSPYEYHTKAFPHLFQLLQNATADMLSVKVEGIHNSREAFVISTLFKSIRFKQLEVSFKGSDDMAKFALSFFSSIKKCQNRFNEIELFWDCEVRQNIHILRQAFLQLPNTGLLEVTYQIKISNAKRSKRRGATHTVPYEKNAERDLIDGRTMLHFMSISEEIRHRIDVTCNAQEIFEAFEMVCDSPANNKLVIILVDMAVADQLFEFVKKQRLFEVAEYMEDPELRKVSDYNRGGLLRAWTLDNGKMAVIDMFKIDRNGRFLGEFARKNFMRE